MDDLVTISFITDGNYVKFTPTSILTSATTVDIKSPPPPPLQCPLCPKRSVNKAALKFHFGTRHSLTCCTCWKSFASRPDKLEHIDKVHKGLRKWNLDIFSEEENAGKGHVSEEKTKTFFSESENAGKSYESDEEENVLQCQVCLQIFNTETAKNFHVIEKHGSGRRPLEVPIEPLDKPLVEELLAEWRKSITCKTCSKPFFNLMKSPEDREKLAKEYCKCLDSTML